MVALLIAKLLLIPLLVQSAAGYVWMALRLRDTGGKVRSDGVDVGDAGVCGILGTMLVTLAIASISAMQKVPPGTVKVLKPGDILNFPIILLVIGMSICGLLVFRRVSLVDFFGVKRVELWKVVPWAIIFMTLAWPVIIAVMQIASHILPSSVGDEQTLVRFFRDEVKNGHYGNIALVVGTAVILAPIGEEFLFRGYFYPVGKRYFGGVASAFATAVLFAFLHANAVSFAGLCVLALCFTLAYEFTGSLFVPMAMHATFNAVNLAVLVAQALSGNA